MWTVPRFLRVVGPSLFMILWFACGVVGQTETATVSGLVTDRTGAAVPGAEMRLQSVERGTVTTTTTNNAGIYVFASVQPGQYQIGIQKQGFKQVDLLGLVVNVQDHIEQNFRLEVGSIAESVTVNANDLKINTTDAAVSTVIDRQFAENLPLNGRSFNTLLQLTPGVVIAPIVASSSGGEGQFSIAGQRRDANNFTVDGASANFGVTWSFIPQESGGGTSQAFSALGGTSSLVSVEALQEFRIETSSFAPEFGRSPGGQVILTTRSGTNDYHGGVYEYFRNDVLDANDWFANESGKPRAPERHNDFGGYLGGRILKDKTFFFVSYEGARLRIPQTLAETVPSIWARTVAAPPSLAPFLNAYPEPNDKTTITPGVYTSPFTGSWSNAATLNAGSVRIDHTFNSRFSIFGRYNEAPSETISRALALSTVQTIPVGTRTATIGFNAFLNPAYSNSVRFNYSTQSNSNNNSPDSFGGAVPLPSNLLFGTLSPKTLASGIQLGDVSAVAAGANGSNVTRQFQFVDDFSFSVGTHQMKYGVDYRVIDLDSNLPANSVLYNATSVQDFLTSNGQVTVAASTFADPRLRYRALSLYAQDGWKVSPRLTITYGIRWELSPAPEARGNTDLASWTNVDNPPLLALAPQGTPLWHTTYGNFAPRVGVAYSLSEKGDFVLRVGGGIFYDLGVGSSVLGNFPDVERNSVPGVQWPLANPTPLFPGLSVQPPYPNGTTVGFSPDLKLPRSYQWNLALEKSFGGNQALSATYVGQAGRDLLRQAAIFQPNPNFAGDFLLTTNEALSNYNALQLQYRRTLSSRLQALLSYSWSHSLDNASNDVVAGLSNTIISAANDYGSSEFDVRHSFSGAVTYGLPGVAKSGPLALLTKDWSVDTVIVVRSGLPFNAFTFFVSPDPGGSAFARPDLVPGQPFYVTGSQCVAQQLALQEQGPLCPGGRALNVAAFSTPSTVRQGTEGRNDIPGFGLSQVDLSLRRQFSITERTRLQFRTDAFNVFNHPNFVNPLGFFEFGPDFLRSQQMLNQGLGGLNSLFQTGGPRSLQLSLKLSF